jgi:hypothetical protein
MSMGDLNSVVPGLEIRQHGKHFSASLYPLTQETDPNSVTFKYKHVRNYRMSK